MADDECLMAYMVMCHPSPALSWPDAVDQYAERRHAEANQHASRLQPAENHLLAGRVRAEAPNIGHRRRNGKHQPGQPHADADIVP